MRPGCLPQAGEKTDSFYVEKSLDGSAFERRARGRIEQQLFMTVLCGPFLCSTDPCFIVQIVVNSLLLSSSKPQETYPSKVINRGEKGLPQFG